MDKTLKNLLYRIKGARLYSTPSKSRLYIPYSLDHYKFKIRIKVYFEIVNDQLQLFVEVFSDDCSGEWCKFESERIHKQLSEQFYEIIYDCETMRKTTALNVRLKDRVRPYLEDTIQPDKQAIRFLCGMKVSVLIGDLQLQRWLIAIRVAQSRYFDKRINKVHVILPHALVKEFKKELFNLWKDIKIPFLVTSIESLSHNIPMYLRLLEYIDPQTMLVIDECHHFKSPKAIRSQRVIEVARKCNYKLIMTDSLIVNNIHDIFAQYKILSDLILGYYRWDDFTKKHVMYGGFGGDQILGYKNLAYLANMTEPYTYTIDSVKMQGKKSVSVNTYVCELTDKQKYYYKQKKGELLTLIQNSEIHLSDIFRIMTEMQKIACGYIPSLGEGKPFEKIFKLNLLKEYGVNNRCIILCKYLFEIDLLIQFLGEANCTVFSRNSKHASENWFEYKQKQYLISTLAMQHNILVNIDVSDFYEIIFFSLSFKYIEYSRCITFIKENELDKAVSIKRFITNSGIDRKIMETLTRKGKLVDEIRTLLKNRNELKKLVACL